MVWRKVKLGDIAEFSNGINFSKDAYSKGVKLIAVSNFGDRFLPEYDLLEEIKEDVVRNNDLLSIGDIVFVRSNGNKELVGRCMLIDNPPDKVTYSGFCIRARFKDTTEHDPVFWTYHFKNMAFRRAMSNTAIGANIQNLSQGRLAVYETMVPDIEGQKRIANILSAYDNLIKNNQKQIKLLEEAAQRLYKEWFVDLRFPGYEDSEIVDGVPVGWTKDTLNDYCEIKSGYTFKSRDWQNIGCGVIKIKDINNGFVDYSACDCVPPDVAEKAKLYYLRKGDLLIAMTGATIGKIGISTKDGYYANQRVGKVFLGDNPLERLPFAYCVLSLQSSLEHILNNSSASSAQPNISGEKIGDIEIIYSQDTIDKFNSIQQPLFAKMILLRQNIEKLGKARDLLLPKLMNGEIEV